MANTLQVQKSVTLSLETHIRERKKKIISATLKQKTPHWYTFIPMLGSSTPLSEQDVEMEIERALTQTSADTSYPPLPPPKETGMTSVERGPSTQTIPHQNVEPGALAFIE